MQSLSAATTPVASCGSGGNSLMMGLTSNTRLQRAPSLPRSYNRARSGIPVAANNNNNNNNNTNHNNNINNNNNNNNNRDHLPPTSISSQQLHMEYNKQQLTNQRGGGL